MIVKLGTLGDEERELIVTEPVSVPDYAPSEAPAKSAPAPVKVKPELIPA